MCFNWIDDSLRDRRRKSQPKGISRYISEDLEYWMEIAFTLSTRTCTFTTRTDYQRNLCP